MNPMRSCGARKRSLGGTFPFIFAFALISFATLMRTPFQKVLGPASPFLFYWPCVLLVAALFGLRPALLATALAALEADYFWMPPQGVFNLNKVQTLQVLTFCFAGISLAWLSEFWHRERLSREHFRATLANAGEAILTVDNQGRIMFMNPAAQLLTGLTSEEAVGQTLTAALFLHHPATHQPRNADFQQLLTRELSQPIVDHLMLAGPRGKAHRVRATISRMVDAGGHSAGRVIVFQSQQMLEMEALPSETIAKK